jgi:tetratricopeptide (TPR) repeat protein
VSEVELPDDIRALILDRLNGLEPELRKLTGRAAVIGRSFTRERLRKLEEKLGVGAATDLNEGLSNLAEQQVLGGEPGDRYFFEHVMSRDAAYNSVSNADKQLLHGVMSEVLGEMLISGTVSSWDILPELVKHLEGCSRYMKAHEYACQMLELMAYTSRRGSCDAWLTRAARLWEIRETATEDVTLLNGYSLTIDTEPAAFPPSPAIHLAAFELHRLRGRFSLALEHANIALDLATDRGESKHKASALLAIGRICEDKCLVYCEKSLAISHGMNDRSTEITALVYLGDAHLKRGMSTEARAYFEKALNIASETGNRFVEGWIIRDLGVLHRNRGELNKAQACCETASTISLEVSDRRGEAYALGMLGTLHSDKGLLAEAQDYFKEALAICREIGDDIAEGRIRLNLGKLHSEQRQTDRAHTCFEKSLEIALEFGNPLLEMRSLMCLGLLHARSSELDKAEQELAQAESTCERLNNPWELGQMHCAWVYYHLAVGRQSAPGSKPSNEAIAKAKKSLAKTEACARKLSILPASPLSKEIEKARTAVKEYEKDCKSRDRKTEAERGTTE